MAVVLRRLREIALPHNILLLYDGLGVRSCCFEPDQDGGHVVAAEARHRVLRQQFLQEFLHHAPIVLPLTDFLLDDVYEALAILHVFLPDAVATDYQELVFARIALHLLDVGLGCDHLLVPEERLVLLVVEVAEGTGEVQPAVDAAHCDGASCLPDAVLLNFILGLVVLGKIDGLARAAEHAARVSSIGHDVPVRSHEDDVGSAASVARNLLVLRHSSLLIQLFGALLTDDQLIHELEGLNQRIPVIL